MQRHVIMIEGSFYSCSYGVKAVYTHPEKGTALACSKNDAHEGFLFGIESSSV